MLEVRGSLLNLGNEIPGGKRFFDSDLKEGKFTHRLCVNL